MFHVLMFLSLVTSSSAESSRIGEAVLIGDKPGIESAPTFAPSPQTTTTTPTVSRPEDVGAQSHGAGRLPTFKNIGYLGAGYDIYFGNPRTSGRADSGFRQSLMEFSYINQRTTVDQRYLIPDQSDVRPQTSCDFNFEHEEFQSAEAYRKSLRVGVDVSFNFFFVSFKSSVDYKRVEAGIKRRGSVFTESVATCNVYSAFLHTYDLPPLQEGFRAAVERLPGCSADADYGDITNGLPLTEREQEAYYLLIRSFGTHYVSKAEFGGLMAIRNEFNMEQWRKMKSKGVDVSVGVHASFFGIGGGVDVTTSKLDEKQNEFYSKSLDRDIIVIGGMPPQDQNPETWLQQTLKEPMPLRYRLEDMHNLLTSLNFPNDPTIECKQNHYKQVMGTYCQRLVAEGQLSPEDCRGQPKMSNNVNDNAGSNSTQEALSTEVAEDYELTWKYKDNDDHPVCLYVPQMKRNAVAIGTIQIRSNELTPHETLMVSLPAPENLIQSAVNWTEVWNDEGSSSKTNVILYRPVCNPGFSSISDFAVPVPRIGWRVWWSKHKASFWTYTGGEQKLGSDEINGFSNGGYFRVEQGDMPSHPADESIYKCLSEKCINLLR